jgi:hypothetical protein
MGFEPGEVALDRPRCGAEANSRFTSESARARQGVLPILGRQYRLILAGGNGWARQAVTFELDGRYRWGCGLPTADH